jgi:hypothetical protein
MQNGAAVLSNELANNCSSTQRASSFTLGFRRSGATGHQDDEPSRGFSRARVRGCDVVGKGRIDVVSPWRTNGSTSAHHLTAIPTELGNSWVGDHALVTLLLRSNLHFWVWQEARSDRRR